MQPNVECPSETANNTAISKSIISERKLIEFHCDLPDQREHKQFLRIEWKIHGEICWKHRSHRIGALEPDGQQAEDGGSTDSGEKSTPIISHGKIRCGDFDAEQDTANGSSKACTNTNGTSGG